MEHKINALKISSKVLSVLTKIGYIAMIVMVCICATMLIFLAVTGGDTSAFTIGNTNIIIFDDLAAPAEAAAISFDLMVMGCIFFAIFLLAFRMFREISRTGEPFTEKYVKSFRAIGILATVLPFATGLAEFLASVITKTEMPEILSETPGMVIGAIIFCFSFVIDYGCSIKKKPDSNSEDGTAK